MRRTPGRLAVPMLIALVLRAAAAQAQPEPKPLPLGAPLFYCAGNDVPFQPIVPPTEKVYTPAEVAAAAAHRAEVARREGLTSLEVYVKWWLCEPERGRWDFSYYDIWAQACKSQGLRWVPLLILGPSYGTPPWFKQSAESSLARCLEHNQETPTQSIWNPALRAHVAEFLFQFASHFDLAQIESVKLGISGDFGESIYPCGGNGWTYLGPAYHIHAGYWCGDDRAASDFASRMQQQYGQIDRLNAAWGTGFGAFEQVRPFLPERAAGRRARLDLQHWYCAAMTDYLDFWLSSTRRLLPQNRIQVSLGGDGAPMAGADFSAQAEVAARHGAGIRITNEGSDYAANYSMTRHVASCCRQYRTYFGIEPAGEVTNAGIAVRIYNATASGADELFTYDPEPAGARAEAYRAFRPLLVKREPLVDVGLLLNQTSRDLGLSSFMDTARGLRTVTDYDMVDDRQIADGGLQNLRALLWMAGPVVEAATYRRVAEWVSGGGLLIIGGLENLETVEGDPAPARELLPAAVQDAGTVPARYALDVGSAADERWLRGAWHGAESGLGLPPPDTTFRWTTPESELELPLPAGQAVTIAVRVVAAGPRPQDQVLQVNGQEKYRVPGPGPQVALLRLAGPELAGKRTVRLRFAGADWKADGADPRRLGIAAVAVSVGSGDLTAAELTPGARSGDGDRPDRRTPGRRVHPSSGPWRRRLPADAGTPAGGRLRAWSSRSPAASSPAPPYRTPCSDPSPAVSPDASAGWLGPPAQHRREGSGRHVRRAGGIGAGPGPGGDPPVAV